MPPYSRFSWTPLAPWDATIYRPGRVSSPITLEAGKHYYVEVLHKQGRLGEYVDVAWRIPGGAEPANGSDPIGSQYLACEPKRTNRSVPEAQGGK
jgi:hypothetical protein